MLASLFLAFILNTYLTPFNNTYLQNTSASDLDNSFKLNLRLSTKQVVAGTKPIVSVIITNTSNHEIAPNCSPYRFNILKQNGDEPTRTQLHRHLRGEYRKEDIPVENSGSAYCIPILPGATLTQQYDLSLYYDLSTAGKYSVNIEINDIDKSNSGPGLWIKSNSDNFEIIPKS